MSLGAGPRTVGRPADIVAGRHHRRVSANRVALVPTTLGAPVPKIVDHEERRDRLIQAFWDVADEEPGELPTVRAVAHAAGVSKTNVGHYFESQAHLVVEAALADTRHVASHVIARDLQRCSLEDATTALLPLCGVGEGRSERMVVLLHAWFISAQQPHLQHLSGQIHNYQSEAVGHVLVAMRARRLIHRSRDLIEEGDLTVAFVNGLVVQGSACAAEQPPGRTKHLLAAHLADLSARPR